MKQNSPDLEAHPIASTNNINIITSLVSNQDLDIVHQQVELEKEEVPTTKWKKFLKKLEVPHEGKAISILRNPDLEPVKDEDRNWGFWSNFAYWGLPNFSVMTYSTGSALLGLNLDIKQSIGAIVIANIIIAGMTILNCNPGLKYHIGYTLDQRMIFGIYGSVIGIIFRVGISVVMYGYIAWSGGLCVNMMLESLSHHYLHLPNYFPDSVPMDTKGLVGFLVFQLVSMSLFAVSPRKIRLPNIISCFMTLFAVIGILAYTVNKAGGPGPLFYQPVELTESVRSWAWIFAITIWGSGVSVGITNQSDFSRFAGNTWSCYLGTFFGVVLPGTFICAAGMFVASACKKLYGVAYWTPNDISHQWLMDNYDGKGRAASFFVGLAFAACQVFLNMTQNGFACGMDLTGLLPKYINCARGTLFVCLISWCDCPWTFFQSSSTFLDAMSAFGMFTLPITIMNYVEFFIIRRSKLSMIDFFTTSPNGSYYYFRGFNIRAVVTLIVSVVLGIPGLYYSCNPQVEANAGMMNFFEGYWFFIPVLSFGLYLVLSYAFPYKHDRLGVSDPVDYFNCFSEKECEAMGMIKYEGDGDAYEIIDTELISQRAEHKSISGTSEDGIQEIDEIVAKKE
ncbi:related to Thiamine transporter THI72 [Saccharomycodes ludwigii]|uniref:Related to Thiamine transporter THI72 n=1 Tax=Saccharomycodes ludwigii TaxID=36035 RepID=A0A376B1T6_9ASCO|nr:related to Thiamine transporter THI72 [Saccharomycodes ludwigii]